MTVVTFAVKKQLHFCLIVIAVSDEQNQIEKISGWDFYAINPKNLSHLSYSQRLSYLN